MKKSIFILGLAVLGLTACTKDWDCECTITAGGLSVSETVVLEDLNKSDATEACDAGDMAEVAGVGSECELK